MHVNVARRIDFIAAVDEQHDLLVHVIDFVGGVFVVTGIAAAAVDETEFERAVVGNDRHNAIHGVADVIFLPLEHDLHDRMRRIPIQHVFLEHALVQRICVFVNAGDHVARGHVAFDGHVLVVFGNRAAVLDLDRKGRGVIVAVGILDRVDELFRRDGRDLVGDLDVVDKDKVAVFHSTTSNEPDGRIRRDIRRNIHVELLVVCVGDGPLQGLQRREACIPIFHDLDLDLITLMGQHSAEVEHQVCRVCAREINGTRNGGVIVVAAPVESLVVAQPEAVASLIGDDGNIVVLAVAERAAIVAGFSPAVGPVVGAIIAVVGGREEVIDHRPGFGLAMINGVRRGVLVIAGAIAREVDVERAAKFSSNRQHLGGRIERMIGRVVAGRHGVSVPAQRVDDAIVLDHHDAERIVGTTVILDLIADIVRIGVRIGALDDVSAGHVALALADHVLVVAGGRAVIVEPDLAAKIDRVDGHVAVKVRDLHLRQDLVERERDRIVRIVRIRIPK